MNQNQIRLMSERKRPQVQLAGLDGNAFAILARVRAAMREVGWTKAEIAEATDDMMAEDYNDLFCAAHKYCEVV